MAVKNARRLTVYADPELIAALDAARARLSATLPPTMRGRRRLPRSRAAALVLAAALGQVAGYEAAAVRAALEGGQKRLLTNSGRPAAGEEGR